MWAIACALAAVAFLTGATSSGARPSGRTLDYWIAAVPVTWNVVPNGRDGIMGMHVPADGRDPRPSSTAATRRTGGSRWRTRPAASADGLLIPGPLIRARVGDRLRIHFKNMDTLRNDPHSMHFHGVHYKPTSDGAYVPGFSGKDAK